jgi:hypothetical protein
MQYRVIWEIDEEEASPEAAARAAWRHMRRPDSTANVFVVIDEEGAATRLDLQEIEEIAMDVIRPAIRADML